MVAAIGAVAAVGGSMISANAAGNAADQQSRSAAEATAAQERAAAQMREDLSPWTNQGVAANNALGYYMGLNTSGTSGGSINAQTYDDIRNQLLGQYTQSRTTTPTGGAVANPTSAEEARQRAINPNWTQEQADAMRASMQASTNENGQGGLPPGSGPYSENVIDEAGLDAAIRARLAEQEAANRAAQEAAGKDPRYGSLLTAYRNGEEFDAGPAFSFTGEDLENEPGYQFGLSQGEQGISRGQASRGNYLSGAAMKELNRFNQDYAGTKFNEGFNRASSTYGTNLTARQNEWNTNLNAYNGNRDRIYNFLTGVSTLGQNSAAQVGASNQQAATQAGNNMMQSGVAQSAGTVASGNALASGINGAANAYNTNRGLNSAGGWNQLLAGQSAQSQNTGTNYLQSGYDALGMPNNI